MSASAKRSFQSRPEPLTPVSTLTKHSFMCLPQQNTIQPTFQRTLKFPLPLTVMQDGGGGGSLSSSSPRRTRQLACSRRSCPLQLSTSRLPKGAGRIRGGGGRAAAVAVPAEAVVAAAGGRMSARGKGAGQPSTSAQGQPAARVPQKRGRGRPRKQQQEPTS